MLFDKSPSIPLFQRGRLPLCLFLFFLSLWKRGLGGFVKITLSLLHIELTAVFGYASRSTMLYHVQSVTKRRISRKSKHRSR